MKAKGTQTLLARDNLSSKLSPVMLVWSACQTSSISNEVTAMSDPIELILLEEVNEKHQERARREQLHSDPIPSDEIDDEKDQKSDEDSEYYNATNKESDKEEKQIIGNEKKTLDETVLLSRNKLQEGQLKFIVLEESIVKLFLVCFKCNAYCNVIVEHRIGTCKIGVLCSANPDHNFFWTTGPLCNRLPIINLMIASSIVCTGMECTKTL